jgi:D-alanyl-D-alanine carboxypeptidase (penicillin-binding protein 5/6)
MASVLMLALLWPTARAAVVPEVSSRTAPSSAYRPAERPTLTARASFAVDITAGVELWAQEADRPLPPASTTKLMTALVVRRWLRPDESITIRSDDLVDPAVYANAGFQPGDRVTVTDLMAAMLIASAGDAALPSLGSLESGSIRNMTCRGLPSSTR